MSQRNAVQNAIDHFGKTAGMVKRSGSWYQRHAQTTVAGDESDLDDERAAAWPRRDAVLVDGHARST
jgi:hypothetical protein